MTYITLFKSMSTSSREDHHLCNIYHISSQWLITLTLPSLESWDGKREAVLQFFSLVSHADHMFTTWTVALPFPHVVASFSCIICYDFAGLSEKGQVSCLLSFFTLSPDDALVQGWGCGVKLVDSGLQGLAKESHYLVYSFILKYESQ